MIRASELLTLALVVTAYWNTTLPRPGRQSVYATGGRVGDVCRVWRATTRPGRIEAGFWSVWRKDGATGSLVCTPFDGEWPAAAQFAAWAPAGTVTIPTAPLRASDPDPCAPLAVVFAIEAVASRMSSAVCGVGTPPPSALAAVPLTDPVSVAAALNQSARGAFFSPRELRYVWDVVCPTAPADLAHICF